MKDIGSKEDIVKVVDSFYTKVQSDELLGPIFLERLGGHWDAHLEKMYDFWNTILFSNGSYKGSPFEKHVKLAVNKEHFDRWLYLFEETIGELFEGKVASDALQRAKVIGWTFWSKIEHLRADEHS